MKHLPLTFVSAAGVCVAAYIGSYFLCVREGPWISSAGWRSVKPTYRYILLSQSHVQKFYRVIHTLDRNCLRRAKWEQPDGIQRVSNLGPEVFYRYTQYDFTFSLPLGWQGDSVLIEQLEDVTYSPAANKSVVMDPSPRIVLRHPQWNASAPNQDIPLLVLSRSQWDDLHHGKP
jgi:hypothetical protein